MERYETLYFSIRLDGDSLVSLVSEYASFFRTMLLLDAEQETKSRISESD